VSALLLGLLGAPLPGQLVNESLLTAARFPSEQPRKCRWIEASGFECRTVVNDFTRFRIMTA